MIAARPHSATRAARTQLPDDQLVGPEARGRERDSDESARDAGGAEPSGGQRRVDRSVDGGGDGGHEGAPILFIIPSSLGSQGDRRGGASGEHRRASRDGRRREQGDRDGGERGDERDLGEVRGAEAVGDDAPADPTSGDAEGGADECRDGHERQRVHEGGAARLGRREPHRLEHRDVRGGCDAGRCRG